MTKYSSSYDPAAPIAKVTVKKTEANERFRGIEMLIDTGSDITLLPKSIIELIDIEPTQNQKYNLIGFDGSVLQAEIYNLQVIFLGKRFTGNYCAVDDAVGILGRDVLNQIVLMLDGPRAEWDEILDPLTASNK